MVNNKLKACVLFTAVLLVLYGTKSVNGYRDPRATYGKTAGVDPADWGGYRPPDYSRGHFTKAGSQNHIRRHNARILIFDVTQNKKSRC